MESITDTPTKTRGGTLVVICVLLIPACLFAANPNDQRGKWVVDEQGATVWVPDQPPAPVSPPAPKASVPAPTPVVNERASFGLGYFTTSAPLGFRWWASEDFGLDLGLGFNVLGSGGTTSNRIAAEAGILGALAHRENLTVFLRLGAGLENGQHGLNTLDINSIDPNAGGSNADFLLNVNLIAGAEYRLTGIGLPNVAFTGGMGAGVQIAKPDGGDIEYALGTANYTGGLIEGLVLGMHFYL